MLRGRELWTSRPILNPGHGAGLPQIPAFPTLLRKKISSVVIAEMLAYLSHDIHVSSHMIQIQSLLPKQR